MASLEVTMITRHTVPNFLNSTSSVLMLLFVQPLSRNCYKLSSAEAFTFMQTFDQNFVFFTEWRHVDRQCDT